MIMQTIEIKNSSAISKISFNEEESLVGVSFTYNSDKEYLYFCDKLDDVKSQVLQIESEGGSIGKLINAFRKDGTLEIIEIEE
jgi:hypothetical protein